ncbi:hypothetical protein [Arthrobacter cavernae]|uniref:Uncharacterized protein n=1 Tax=Arthrobacter cavernae TaxID=2817681 RepID=A0A939HGA1_9MICC|nr:hypothetical protein [Arthrobacter cavernae]MBO1266768.1 hypothetical protein [Arthrobacter cavernae]
MLSLVIVVLATVAAGFIVWANDRHHAAYGIAVPAGVAVAVGMLSWIVCLQIGLGYRQGLTWIPWVLPIVLGSAASVAAALFLGRARAKHDIQALTAALKL